MNYFKAKDENSAGIFYGIIAYLMWGFLPLYWKLMQVVPAVEIIAHRIVWSFVFMFLLVLLTGGLKETLKVMVVRKKLLMIFLCGLIISVNWLTYIYAINADHVIETSMGYYMNPLVVVLFSVLILKEKMTRWQVVSIILASIGVLIITFQYGRIPWIALFLAVTFALYGLIKKIIKLNPVTGLVLETLIVLPVALIYIFSLESTASGAMSSSPAALKFILAGTGIITATPLLFFARGIELTTFSMMGFLQYIAPSITLLLGIFIFKENFTVPHIISFGFIWVALAIFTLANVGVLKEPELLEVKV